MKVSFIIPLYNCLPLTQAMLASLRATVPAGLTHEIILVDDGSSDGTRDWLRTLDAAGSHFKIILNEHNLGYAGANNRGALAARGDLLVLLNNDLVLTRRWLEPMLAAHARLGTRAGFVGNVQRNARTWAVDHTGIVVNLQGKPEHDTRFPRWPGCSDRAVMGVTGACMLVQRALFLGFGGFDEGFVNGCEDVDVCLRAEALGLRNVTALRSVIGHHISASPGRKQRDEENTRRLTLRWRDALARHGSRRWCRHYLETCWTGTTADPDHAFARAALAYVLHLSSTPPPGATAGMQAAIDRELARWSLLFDKDAVPHHASCP